VVVAIGSRFMVILNMLASYRQHIPSPYVSAISKVYAPLAMYAVLETAPLSVLRLPVD
jgi:hypothetical protein